MNQDRPIVGSDGAIRLLPVAFLVIIAGFVLGNLLAIRSARRTQAANRQISQDALVSIDDVSRIVHDIDLVRLLIDAHILASTSQETEPLERRIRQVEANLSGVAQEYEPLTTFPGEREVWESLWSNVGELRQPINHVLDLSRVNRDAEARQAMVPIEKEFDVINQQAEQLLRLNRSQARGAVAEIQELQRRTVAVFAVLTVGGTLLALLVAAWVIGLVRKRDRQIRQTAALLEQRNRELDAFAGRVAHDLRGPLTAISLSTLRLSDQLPENDGSLAVLQRGVSRMDALIRDLLALSRAGAEATATVANTRVIASTLEDELISKVDSADGRLWIDVQPAEVQCSEVLLRQALWNLGENAVKYRRSDARLEIGIQGRKVGHSYEFRVSDNGTGMSPEDASHVFDPFFRASATRYTSGTGLGLSIVKRVIEASGGKVSVSSDLGRGTTFLIALPLASEAQEPGHKRAV